MYIVYSLILSLGFLLMLPLFLLRREKYASGFSQRLGNYPEFKHDGRDVIWLHCVSVGETNAARPLVDALADGFPNHRLIISTTTKTGQELARKTFADKADATVYFPFDWKFSVRRPLETFKPSLVLLMETEIWPRFIHEAKLSGAKVAIVNGRVSQRSFERYSKVSRYISRVLDDVDLAMMQTEKDADRIARLGMEREKIAVTGNLKFEQAGAGSDQHLTEYLRTRFAVSTDRPLIIAASTHEPEERYVMDALEAKLGSSCRLMIAPRHPERFDTVAKLFRGSRYSFVRRSDPPSDADRSADIILLDSIGELRAAYPLAEIVFVGGSLIPHGGQSILEPAVEGKAILTGPYTGNFDAVVKEFLANDAIIQTCVAEHNRGVSMQLSQEFTLLLANKNLRNSLGDKAATLLSSSKRNATRKTLESIRYLVD